MLLYATISADKLINGKITEVSKGQGGNKYLKIIIRDEQKHCIAYLTIKPATETQNETCEIDILEKINLNVSKCVQINTDDDEIKSQKALPKQCEGCKKAGWKACCNLQGSYHKSQKAINGEKLSARQLMEKSAINMGYIT